LLDLNSSFVSFESKRIDFDVKKVDVLKKNSLLEREVKEHDEKISQLVKEVNNAYNIKKHLNISLNKSSSNPPKARTQKLNFNFDLCNNVNTQDSRVQT
jgi:hypothetical protein